MNNQPTQFLAQTAAFWREQLQGFTAPTALAVERTTGSSEPGRGCQPIHTPALADAILVKQHLDPAVVLVGLWALLLHRYSGETDVTFGIQFPKEPAGNPVPLRLQVAPELSLLDWLSTLQAQWVALQPHRQVSLEQIQQWGELPEGRLFESVVYFADAAIDPAQIPCDYPLTLLAELSASPTLWIHYDLQTFEAATIARLAGHLQTLLEGMVTQFDRRVAEQPLLTASERHQILAEWNSNQVELPQQCIHQLFEAQVERTPDAIALIRPAGADSNQPDCQKLTYRELNQRANQLAHYLQACGVGVDTPVGICFDRSVEMAVGLLGSLKAGAGYLPLDPSYPVERLVFMLEDAQVSVLLTQSQLLPRLPIDQALADRVRVICLDTDWKTIEQQPTTVPPSSVTPDALGYVIYTSGSTGQPKGVIMSQRPLVNLLLWQASCSVCGPATRTLQFTPISFDVSFQEIFATWINGGTLVLIPEMLRRDPTELLRFLVDQAINRLFLPFVALQQLAEAASSADRLPQLREVITAGEQLQITRQIARWFGQMPHCSLHNHYGPSESHVVTAYRLAGPPSGWMTLPPIGRPIANTRLYIANRQLQLQPIDVAGELCIEVCEINRGYLNRPELTQEKFIPHPFSDRAGARLYKTGDLACYRADGTIEYLGRLDQQVKIRGFRVELGEVEATLSQHPAVQEAVLTVREDVPGDKRLVAYVVLDSKHSEQKQITAALRQFLQQRLPEYMLPSTMVLVEALPLTPSGKVDRKALVAAVTARPDLEISYVAPKTALEQQLANLWMQMLRLDRVGIQDNFFELGGSSILGTQMMIRLQQILDQKLSALLLYQYPTVEKLAGFLERQVTAQPSAPVQSFAARAQQQRAVQHQIRMRRGC